MIEYIADGEIHPLDENFAGILRYIDISFFEDEALKKIKNTKLELISKYASYILKYNPSLALHILVNYLIENIDEPNEEHKLIFREADYSIMPQQLSSMALKFRRAPKDNLELKND